MSLLNFDFEHEITDTTVSWEITLSFLLPNSLYSNFYDPWLYFHSKSSVTLTGPSQHSATLSLSCCAHFAILLNSFLLKIYLGDKSTFSFVPILQMMALHAHWQFLLKYKRYRLRLLRYFGFTIMPIYIYTIIFSPWSLLFHRNICCMT